MSSLNETHLKDEDTKELKEGDENSYEANIERKLVQKYSYQQNKC